VYRACAGAAMSTLVATIKAYRRTGGAAVTVARQGRQPHRYQVSLRRYHALRQWTVFGEHRWKASGSWFRSSVSVCLWDP
jgi:hypothetical protein